jgi:hypothetical protein
MTQTLRETSLIRVLSRLRGVTGPVITLNILENTDERRIGTDKP